MEAIVKTIMVTIVCGGILIASFYFAYLLLIIIVLGSVAGIAYCFFNIDKIFGSKDLSD